MMARLTFIWEMTRRDFVERFAGSVLGTLWVVIWPLVNMFVYIVIFGKFMGARLPGSSNMSAYGVYLAVGLIPWISFSSTVSRSSNVFLEKKGIITKINTSLPSLLVFINFSEAITFVVSMAVVFLILLFTGASLSWFILYLPIVYYIQQIFALALGLIAACLTVFVRDVREVVGVLLQLWFWFTPIIYVLDIVPEFAQKIMIFNPMLPIISSYHNIFIYHSSPQLIQLCVVAFAFHVLLVLSFIMFRYLEKDIRDFL